MHSMCVDLVWNLHNSLFWKSNWICGAAFVCGFAFASILSLSAPFPLWDASDSLCINDLNWNRFGYATISISTQLTTMNFNELNYENRIFSLFFCNRYRRKYAAWISIYTKFPSILQPSYCMKLFLVENRNRIFHSSNKRMSLHSWNRRKKKGTDLNERRRIRKRAQEISKATCKLYTMGTSQPKLWWWGLILMIHRCIRTQTQQQKLTHLHSAYVFNR